MSAKTTPTQVRFRYTAAVVNLVTVFASIKKYTGMSHHETYQVFDQASENKRRFFTVNALNVSAAKDLAAALVANDCQVKNN